MAVLLTFTRISSRAIVGVARSLNINCPPYSNNLTAFMRALYSLGRTASAERAVTRSLRERRRVPHHSTQSAATIVWILRQCLGAGRDRKSTRLNSSHSQISYAVF